jgi:hypothetical protein
MKKILVLAAVAAFALSGCAALGSVNQFLTSAKNPVVQAAVDVAVGAAVGSGTEAHAKAQQIATIAQQVYTASSAPATTIAELESVLNTEIMKVAPNAADKAAFELLASTLEAYLQSYINSNPPGAITNDTLVSIQGVAKAVITAASFY